MEGMSPSQEVSIIFVPLLLAALVSSALAGRMSDKMGGRRKIFVYASGTVMAVVCASFAFNTSFLGCILLATVFGAAFGIFLAIDLAMVVDVLPDQSEASKDMGVWHCALVLPQLLATPVSGAMLDGLRASYDAATAFGAVFFLAGAYFLAGTVLVRQIRGIK